MMEEKFESRKRKNDPSMMSDSEVKSYVDSYFNREKEKLAEKRKFIQSIRSIISDRQIIALHNSEKRFRKEVFERYKKSKNGKVG